MKWTLNIFIQFLCIGIVLTILSCFHLLSSTVLAVLFYLLLFTAVYLLFFSLKQLTKLDRVELSFVYLLMIVWCLHFLQVLVPETGFDALWYHLPVTKAVIENKGLVYIPNLYQSVNPLFSDLYFLTGYSVLGILGAKIIAFIFGIHLVFATYFLSRVFLSKKYSLVITLIVSSFQVVAWQSSSFYVDVAKAYFEITGILLFFTQPKTKSNKMFWGLLFFSASLATKLFSLFLLPAFLYIVQQYRSPKVHKYMQILMSMTVIFLLPLPYYFFAYAYTNNAFYSLGTHVNKLHEIGGESNVLVYVFEKMISFPVSIYYFMFARDYVFPILVFFIFALCVKGKKINKFFDDKSIKIIFIFSIWQWLLWWFIPPLSTRYALSGFITLLIFVISLFLKLYVKNKQQHTLLSTILVCSVLLTLMPRIVIAYRSLRFILGNQNQVEYLQQFYDGNIDQKIQYWYKIPDQL